MVRGRVPFLIAVILLSASQPSLAWADRILANGKPISDRSSDDYRAGRACQEHLQEARIWAAEVLGEDAPWIQTPVLCEVAYDTGCGSVMHDSELDFLTGGEHGCARSVYLPEYVYHEWAHGLNHTLARVVDQSLDEALADTFATYLTGNPKFGQGMYTERERSWQRDLSERKIYDGPTKQTYTQSLTLSGAWWEFRLRLERDFGKAAGPALAREIFLEHLRALGRAQVLVRLEQDADFALATAHSRPTWDMLTRVKAECALNNAFVDHGFGTLAANCARDHWKTEDERVLDLLTTAGLRHATIARASVDEIRLPDSNNGLPLPNMIPDGQSLWLNFDLRAPAACKAAGVVFRSKIEHPYSEDLLIRLTSPDGTRHDIFKGEEELAVPAVITDRFAFVEKSVQGRWSVEIVNSGSGMGGWVRAGMLEIVCQSQ